MHPIIIRFDLFFSASQAEPLAEFYSVMTLDARDDGRRRRLADTLYATGETVWGGLSIWVRTGWCWFLSCSRASHPPPADTPAAIPPRRLAVATQVGSSREPCPLFPTDGCVRGQPAAGLGGSRAHHAARLRRGGRERKRKRKRHGGGAAAGGCRGRRGPHQLDGGANSLCRAGLPGCILAVGRRLPVPRRTTLLRATTRPPS